MSIDNISEWSYSCAIPVWCVYESTGFHLGNIGSVLSELRFEAKVIIRLKLSEMLS